MSDVRMSKMKKIIQVAAGLLIILLLPAAAAAASARGDFFIGFGAGLLAGYLPAPRPIYVAPPAYTLPPQVVQIYPDSGPTSSPGQGPPPGVIPPPVPSAPEYAHSAPPPDPDAQAKCREWRVVERRSEDRWDSNSGKWQQVPVEKWDWVEIPCDSKGMPPEGQESVNVEGPPAYSFSAPPEVSVIPGTYAYLVPDIGVDILFYQGYWYRPYAGRWFFARSYNGPWGYLAPARVPSVLVKLPPGHLRLSPGYHRIPYRELQTNWRRWESERRWHSDRGWHEGGRARPERRGGEERGRGR
jgi:hypothetical protein